MRKILTAAATFIAVISQTCGAFAQFASAPAWCSDILESNPKVTPIAELYERASQSIQPKGEFETDAAFKKRVDEALPLLQTWLVSATGTSRIIVAAPIKTSYEADMGYFSVGYVSKWPITGPNDFPTKVPVPPGFEAVAVESNKRAADEYVGQNAYGATRLVNAEGRDEYGVAILNLRLTTATSWIRPHFIVRMSPEDAAAIGGKLSVLLVGELTAPGILQASVHSKPTLQTPYEVFTNKRYVTINASCGGVIARESGALLHRLN